MKFGIVVFPGSNCDDDAYFAVTEQAGAQAVYLWHKDSDLKGVDVVVLPGGFSYGDYLRSGALARYSPIMQEVIRHANAGGLVLGICNGFQVACEAGLLPGALLRNKSLKFLSQPVNLRVETTDTPFTNQYSKGDIIRMPLAHGGGRFAAEADTLAELEDNNQVVFRYSNTKGEIDDASNPNGSMNAIAGIVNKGRNVLGIMPHPERAVEQVIGSDDGIGLFKSLLSTAGVK